MPGDDRLRLHTDDYDFAILHPAFRRLFGTTDLYNYGYWRSASGEPIETLPEAATRLVSLHIDTDPQRDTARTVLDVGCGLGACTALFAAGYPEATITGINYSARQIAYANDTYASAQIRFHQMDATALDFPDQRVDCIHAVEAAMHFRPRSAFFAEARRLLVPGGRLILTDVLADRPTSFIPSVNDERTPADYARTLQAAGLEPVEIRDIRADTILPFAGVMHRSAMHAYGREIEESLSAYLLVCAVNPG